MWINVKRTRKGSLFRYLKAVHEEIFLLYSHSSMLFVINLMYCFEVMKEAYMKAPCKRKCGEVKYCTHLIRNGCKEWQDFIYEMRKGREKEYEQYEYDSKQITDGT